MLHSRDRILTTHVGSLPRNDTLTDLLIGREAGKAIDPAVLAAEMDRAVRDTVAAQVQAGIDIGNDGEQQRVGFQTYIPERMSGFGGEFKRKIGKDFQEVPELLEMFARRFPRRAKISNAPQAVAEVRYRDTKDLEDEIARFQACTAAAGTPFAETFATAPSPGIVATTMMNAYYKSHEDYLMALAREMRPEYLAIHEAGLILQIDAPDLAMERTMTFQDLSEEEFLGVCELHMAAINTRSRASPGTACGCTAAGATGRARTSTTSGSRRSCRSSIRRMPARSPSSSPTRATSTSTRRCAPIRCPRTGC